MTTLCPPILPNKNDPTNKDRFFDDYELEILRGYNSRELPPPKTPGASCDYNLFCGFFFDGTGNNYDVCLNDPLMKEGFSNIARLYDAFPGQSVPGVPDASTEWPGDFKQVYKHFFRVYVPGVGTPFPQIDDQGGSRGLAMGHMGQRRILWALAQAINNVSRYFTEDICITDDQVIAFDRSIDLGWHELTQPGWQRAQADDRRDLASNSACKQLGQMLSVLHQRIAPYMKPDGVKPKNPGKTTVNQIFVSCFGFSRGATEARVFANWLLLLCRLDAELCRQNGFQTLASHTLGGFPVSFDFLGLFDTVASIGLASSTLLFDGHGAWADAEHSLRIAPAIRKCVHMVAAHEIRRSFPLDSTQIGGTGSAEEIVYPGSHSDIGGGYLPCEQGRGTDPSGADMLARIPLADMYRKARLAGVPLKPELMKKEFQDRYMIDPVLISDFNAYLALFPTPPSDFKQLLTTQYWPYLAWRLGILNHQGPLAMQDIWPGAKDFERKELAKAHRQFKEHFDIYCQWYAFRDNAVQQYSWERPNRRQPRYAIPTFDPDYARHWNELLPLMETVAQQRDASAITASPYYLPVANRFFEKYVHDSFAGFHPLGTDVAEVRQQLEQLSRAADAKLRALTEQEKAWVQAYRDRGELPDFDPDGFEPMWLGAGYLRYRKTYAGADNLVLTRRGPTRQSSEDSAVA